MARAKEELLSRGLREITLWVLRSNQRACRFYEAQDFQPDGASKIEHNRDGVAFDEVRYRVVMREA